MSSINISKILKSQKKSKKQKSKRSNNTKSQKLKTHKNINKSIVSKQFLLKNQNWSKQENIFSYRQGKGYGGSSISREVEICAKIMNNTPSIFIDIGSEKGTYTKEVLKYFPDIEVYMFEPSIIHKEIYKTSLEKMPNIHINYLALSNINGKQKLYYDVPGSPFASLTKKVRSF